MNLKFRRHAVGIFSGALASTVLLATLHYGFGVPFWRRNWGSLFRSFPACAPSLCGQPHGGRLPRCSPVGSDQCDRRPFAFRSDAGVERRTDAPTFPCFGRLGGVWRFSGNHQSGLTGRRRTCLRCRADPQSVGSFGEQTYCLSWAADLLVCAPRNVSKKNCAGTFPSP